MQFGTCVECGRQAARNSNKCPQHEAAVQARNRRGSSTWRIMLTVGVAVAIVVGVGYYVAKDLLTEPKTVTPSVKAEEVTHNWLIPFTHSNPEYLNLARSAFSYVEEEDLCPAASRFSDLVDDAQDHDGERLPAASFNAGALYLILRWNGYGACGRDRVLPEAVSHLEYALEHMPGEEFDVDISMLLGNAYANLYDLGNDDAKMKALQHLCKAAEDEFHRDWAVEIVVALDASCDDLQEQPSG